MSNLEVITRDNKDRIQVIGGDLARIYKIAFAGPPWYEVSKCASSNCAEQFSASDPGQPCVSCGEITEPAYTAEDLIGSWQRIIDEDGYIEVDYLDGLPQRATIARPTNPDELFDRKYATVPAMRDVLGIILPEQFVWIEDTFADRKRQVTGNLVNRGATLKRVSEYYAGLQIATRTLSEAIVAATVRDIKTGTVAYIGSEGVGASTVNTYYNNPGYSLPTVPDRRTLLNVKSVR